MGEKRQQKRRGTHSHWLRNHHLSHIITVIWESTGRAETSGNFSRSGCTKVTNAAGSTYMYILGKRHIPILFVLSLSSAELWTLWHPASRSPSFAQTLNYILDSINVHKLVSQNPAIGIVKYHQNFIGSQQHIKGKSAYKSCCQSFISITE